MLYSDFNLNHLLRDMNRDHICHQCLKKQSVIKRTIEIEKIIVTQFPTYDCQNLMLSCEYSFSTLLHLRVAWLIQELKINGTIDFYSLVELDED